MTSTQHASVRVRISVWVVWVVVAVSAVCAVLTTETQARDRLNERTRDRTSVGAQFVESYVADLFAREGSEAQALLSAPVVSDSNFAIASHSLGFPAAVLLDNQGRVLNVVPPKPEAIGKDLTGVYDHLRRAVAGEPAISGVVPSAVERIPIVAFALPFDTPNGRRVFSGGFDLSTTPLGSFLKNALSIKGSRSVLVDGAGGLVASGVGAAEPTLAEHDPPMSAAWALRHEGTFVDDGQRFRYASHEVEGTTWRFVIAIPTKALYAPLQAGKVALRLVAFALVAFAALVAFLVDRLSARSREIADARDDALAATQHKSAFLASMSHEIRTPMNGVVGMTDLLLSTPLDEQQREYAVIAQSSAQSLLAIVDDILDFSKIEAGHLDIEAVPFEPRVVVNAVADMLRVQAEAKGVHLEVTIAHGVPEVLSGDPTRVRQIITNLVSNAVKFTSEGSVHLDVRRSPTTATGLRIEVTDTGIGMDEETAASIFQPFIQAESSTTRRFGGTGLGLTITKRLSELMGGDCGVHSSLGHGSTFWVEIPLPSVEKMVQSSHGRSAGDPDEQREPRRDDAPHEVRGGIGGPAAAVRAGRQHRP